MAEYHLSVSSVSRGKGRSVTAASAYQTAERLRNPFDNRVHDYRRKSGVAATGLEGYAGSRADLWSATETIETRKNARLAVALTAALPVELEEADREALTVQFARELAAEYRAPVDWALHAPHREGDERNYHAHLLVGCRTVENGTELGKRVVPFDGPDQVIKWRARWAAITNEALQRAGCSETVDHRSLIERGIVDRLPQMHLGPSATAIQRKENRAAHKEGRKPEIVTRKGRFMAWKQERFDRVKGAALEVMHEADALLQSAIQRAQKLVHDAVALLESAKREARKQQQVKAKNQPADRAELRARENLKPEDKNFASKTFDNLGSHKKEVTDSIGKALIALEEAAPHLWQNSEPARALAIVGHTMQEYVKGTVNNEALHNAVKDMQYANGPGAASPSTGEVTPERAAAVKAWAAAVQTSNDTLTTVRTAVQTIEQNKLKSIPAKGFSR